MAARADLTTLTQNQIDALIAAGYVEYDDGLWVPGQHQGEYIWLKKRADVNDVGIQDTDETGLTYGAVVYPEGSLTAPVGSQRMTPFGPMEKFFGTGNTGWRYTTEKKSWLFDGTTNDYEVPNNNKLDWFDINWKANFVIFITGWGGSVNQTILSQTDTDIDGNAAGTGRSWLSINGGSGDAKTWRTALGGTAQDFDITPPTLNTLYYVELSHDASAEEITLAVTANGVTETDTVSENMETCSGNLVFGSAKTKSATTMFKGRLQADIQGFPMFPQSDFHIEPNFTFSHSGGSFTCTQNTPVITNASTTIRRGFTACRAFNFDEIVDSYEGNAGGTIDATSKLINSDAKMNDPSNYGIWIDRLLILDDDRKIAIRSNANPTSSSWTSNHTEGSAWFDTSTTNHRDPTYFRPGTARLELQVTTATAADGTYTLGEVNGLEVSFFVTMMNLDGDFSKMFAKNARVEVWIDDALIELDEISPFHQNPLGKVFIPGSVTANDKLAGRNIKVEAAVLLPGHPEAWNYNNGYIAHRISADETIPSS